MTPARAVLFDFYGTLAYAPAWGPPVEEVLAARGLRTTPEARARWDSSMFDGQEHHEHSSSRDAYEAWERARLAALAEACGAPECDLDAVVGELHAALRAFEMSAYPEAAEVLTALREQGTTVAVCSNWGWDLDQSLAEAGLDGLVDVMVTSAQVGVRKPHPRIYEVTLEACRVEPGEALFVGDTWTCDVEGPLAVGMRAVHVARARAATDAAPPVPEGARRANDLWGVLAG